ncbi:phosphonate ABC transporter, permease protein PhnE [Truepera radiovictrix]|uniref:Phosphonate ABC transporter, inner membrane subunit n=1 Tax=Truepera radiovictrix (strain DSM 17093 / CIP 108686 / LMG 22925 / RQ-24) TaxID=649638 RepID=D7CQP4_TRURR|nr:phosphonate ABC transporter, permease protein PhnE [Truepera radiovictrix]ADI15028.1 phosphonate ABC transporter, inner membrane subunit [Truepera radiovictrix DSM 17093]WMT56419.1 phosphonate ABC transporter, permease protein PhnE [Truepera radiovictrix]
MALPEAKPPPPALPQRPLAPRLLSWGVWLAFALLLYVSAVQTGFRLDDLWGSTVDFVLFFRNFWPPDWRALSDIGRPLVQTLQMAWLGTVFGVLLGLPWLFWSSRNTSPSGLLLWFSRTLMTVLRSIPDLVYAAVLVGVLALGPLPGVVALTIFTLSILAKLGSEYVEAVDPGPLEALRASGASGTHVIVYGVVPQVAASLVSYILYIFEVNVRASTVLGFVGAGGVGQLLNTYTALFQYRRLTVLLLVTFVVVAIIDAASAWVRSRLT